jgi:purine-nucleoside phosphorylase
MKGKAKTAVVLGSGLSQSRLPGEILDSVSFGEIPGMVAPTVEGHPGRIVLLQTGRGRVLVFQGRNHIYEGVGAGGAGATVDIAARLGCRRILLAQAAGSMKESVPAGSWLIPSDVVSLPWRFGFRGRLPARAGGSLISPLFRDEVVAAVSAAGLPFRDGVLFWTAGPAYETPAEAAAAVLMGADAATMSSLPELLEARANGLEVACMSWITNYTPNLGRGVAVHEEVLRAGRKGAGLLAEVIRLLD